MNITANYDMYTDVLTGLLTTSFEDDQIFFSGTHTDDQRVVIVDIYGKTHMYMTGRKSREDVLNHIRTSFLRAIRISDEASVYVNDFYITPIEGDMTIAHSIVFYISIDNTGTGEWL